MGNFAKAVVAAEVSPGQCRAVEVEGKLIALFNVDGKFHAIDNTCAHRGGPLGEGELDGNVVTCPWHGWQFDVMTGRCATNPAAKVAKYNVKMEGDSVFVEI